MRTPGRDVAGRPGRTRRPSARPGSRKGAPSAVLSLQQAAGNRAVARLVGDSDARIEADPTLGGGWTEADGRTRTLSGRVGGVDRILLGGLSGQQGRDSWGASAQARAGHAAAAGGAAGHRGRAVALVPHTMKHQGGPISVVVHLHGIDSGSREGTSGMRERGDRPEDVRFFQIPQQLEAFSKRHPDARVVVLMPLGATVKAGRGFTVDFGVDDWDAFVDQCLAKLGITATGDPPGSVYMSAHSGGGFTISQLSHTPFRKYRFGGVFGFESFHQADIATWTKLIQTHLKEDLAQLSRLGKHAPADLVAARQLAYLRDRGFRFAAFGGYGGYGANASTLHSTIATWLADHDAALKAATGGDPAVLDQLRRNYQATYTGDRPLAPGQDRHMAALAQDSHFETALESLVPEADAATQSPEPSTSAAQGPPTNTAAQGPPTNTATQGPPTKTPSTRPKPSSRPQPSPHPKPSRRLKPGRTPSKPAQSHVRSRSLQDPFQFESWPLSGETIVLVAGDDEHSRQHVTAEAKAEKEKKAAPAPGLHPDMTGVPSEFMPEILRRAKVPDPDNFFNRFVGNLSFLGRPISSAIHEHLAEHLRGVEQDLATQFGGPDKDPKVAGDALGLGNETHFGSRQVSATAAISMHMFGLAIDVNHYANPYLQAGGGLPSEVFASISLLMEGRESSPVFNDPDHPPTYAEMRTHNQMVIDYFALADPAREPELRDKLQHAPKPWHRRNVQQARRQIEQDLARLGRHTKRDDDLEMLRTHGYLQLREEVVRGMKMNWGAWYGDMMHFDMRTDGGIGQRISGEIRTYLGELSKQQAAAARTAAKATATP